MRKRKQRIRKTEKPVRGITLIFYGGVSAMIRALKTGTTC